MRKIIILFIVFFSAISYAQEPQLAFQYYRNGDYEKAASIYKSLHQKHPYNTNYLTYLINSYQQIEQFDEAALIINNYLEKNPTQEFLFVELGYNYELQHLPEKAIPYYEKALKAIDKSANIGYLIGKTFQENHLLDYALLAYKKAMKLNPNLNYNFQIAFIYGEKAEIEKMFTTYLNMVEKSENFLPTVKNFIGRYITTNSDNENNNILKKLLLKRSQNNPHTNWNQLLSWLFIQQKEYEKALIQEKALYKRGFGDLNNILNVGKIAFDNKNFTASKNIFNYILEQTTNLEIALTSKLYLLQIDINSNANHVAIEQQFQQIFNTYGKTIETLNIQAIYAEFLAFKKTKPNLAIAVLKNALKLPINQFQKGQLKIKLADILVFTNKFSSALIYYTQVQNSLKNHVIGQSARFKIAQTSYFKGDFEWAQSQLKVLKNSTSQLIANDALDLNLLITDNTVKDSLKLALKKYAKADLLAYQNQLQQAADTLQVVLNNHKGHPIEDEALFKQAKLFEKLNLIENAKKNYLKIIEINKTDILADDAHYFLAQLYLNKLLSPEKAKEYFQKIIFEFPSSIYLVDARKKYRKLRGDNLK